MGQITKSIVKSPNYLRVGQTVVHRNDILRKLAQDVQHLVGRIEGLQSSPFRNAAQLRESYQVMIQDRCQLMAQLSAATGDHRSESFQIAS